MQVLSDEGEHLFDTFQGGWIPDTAERRTEILQALTNWSPFSKSAPGKGILAAIDSVAAADQSRSISTAPVIYNATGSLLTSASYASLMRELSQRNGGSFIGLPARD